MGSWQYDETDFERLSLIMMLYGLDFTVEEIKNI
ncbi:MerR family transcriptional regulator [Faecalibacillus intestinalis]|nr:MerR family transcriptional regulator [Faecalibacillus intestinalis]